MEVRLFGPLEVLVGDVAQPIRGAKQRALVAVLALHRGAPVSADRLIDLLWGDGNAANPANALQAQIGQLRRILGADAISTTEAGYALDLSEDDLDIARFEERVGKGRRLLDERDVARASSVLGEALRLRRGEPLAEFVYAGFADAERARLEELTLAAVEARAGADLELGRHGELVGELESLCREHPLRERLWELLILALYRDGRQAEALRAYAEARDRLVEELGIDPGTALHDLEARVLAQDPSLTPAIPSEPLPAASPWSANGNLRARLSSFVGRDTEREQLLAAVRSNRLVTLIGPGGVGKTRLAVEAGAALGTELRDGAWLVELAGIANRAEVAPATARAVGAVGSSGPRSPGSAAKLIVDHLAGRTLVVILDNCEHVVGEAAALAEQLVGAVAGLHLIATSREPLGVPGEMLLPVAGLSVAAAVELFADRARAVQPGFVQDGPAGEVVAEICRRLDGLPLAVELAAARLRALPLATLAERLDDRFRLLTGGARTALPRQQTLRAVVDWSYDLLFDDERRLFARLAVFSGGCELAAAEAVCADDELPGDEVLDVLSRLVDKSLVTPVGADHVARFTQLQTLWQYGRERLDHSPEADIVHARHADYYLRMAVQAHTGLRGATGPLWRQRVGSEVGNLRSALDWFIAAGDADAAVRLASGLAWHWFLNSDFAEGARWLGDALGATGSCRSDVGAMGHAWHSYFIAMSSNPAVAVVECEEAIALLATGDELRRLEALVCSAAVLVRAHNFARSLERLRQARDLLEVPGRGWFLATHDLLLAWNLVSLGRLDEAGAAARSSAERFDAEGEVFLVTSSLHGLAGIVEAQGDLDGAAVAYELLLERCRVTGQRQYTSFALVALGTLRSRQGDDAAADRLYEEAIGHTVNPWPSADAMVGRAAIARRLGDLAGARELLDAAQSRYRQVDLPAGSAGVLVGLAWWALAADRPDLATAFAADAARVAAVSGDPGIQSLADTAVAAVLVVAEPTPANAAAFRTMAEGRARRLAFPPLVTDDPDVAALLARLTLLAGA